MSDERPLWGAKCRKTLQNEVKKRIQAALGGQVDCQARLEAAKSAAETMAEVCGLQIAQEINEATYDKLTAFLAAAVEVAQEPEETYAAIEEAVRASAPEIREQSQQRQEHSPQPAAPEQPPEQHVQREKARDDVRNLAQAVSQLEVAEKPKRKLARCEKCGETKAKCICLPDESKKSEGKQKHKKATRSVEEEDSSTDSTDASGEGDTSSDTKSSTSSETQHTSSKDMDRKKNVDLDEPGTLLNPHKWGRVVSVHGEVVLREALRDFYADETRKRKHEVQVLTDVAAKLGKALSRKKTDPRKAIKDIEGAAQRCLSRLEFLAGYARLGPKGAAAIEEALLDSKLPKDIRAARKQGEKFRPRGRGGQEQRGRGVQRGRAGFRPSPNA